MMNKMSILIDRYLSTINININKLKLILYNLHINDSNNTAQFKNILDQSANNLTIKWKNNQKTLRTKIAFEIIHDYPENILNISLCIDAMINLIDDIYDELLTKSDMNLYIVEIIRNLAIFNQMILSDIKRKKISDYFHKILCIAILESLYKEKIKKSTNYFEKINYTIECYNCKSLDMDIFIELPLYELNIDLNILQNIIYLSRIYRAICILMKDINDLEHDKMSNTETPIVILSEDMNNPLKDYIDICINHYKEVSKEIFQKYNENGFKIINKLKKLIQSEVDNYYKNIGIK